MEDYYYKVIEILDEYSILINYGADEGADEGDLVRVIAIGPEVKDPDTGNLLGTLDSVKSELTVVTAYNNFSLCKKVVTSTKSHIINPLSQFQTTNSEIKRLNIKEDSISNKKIPDDKIINVGDKVEVV